MAQWLNKLFIIAFSVCPFVAATAQSVAEATNKDYKDPKSHEKFRKRRMAVSAWQVNQLKDGALVVRLKTSAHLINGLKKRGEEVQAEKARLEQMAINRNFQRAFLDKYSFSKVYFIYSHSSDSLLQGVRSGYFLDTNLRIDPSIRLNENFYLLAETDYIYNSSIGFVPQDSAVHVVEQGNPSSSEAPIVVKNKYGHQLKDPFPYSETRYVYAKPAQVVHVGLEGRQVPVNVRGFFADDGVRDDNRTGDGVAYDIQGRKVELSIPRAYTYEALSQVVNNFNGSLNEFYRRSATLETEAGKDEDMKQFFY